VHFREIGCEGVDWMHAAEDKGLVVSSCEHRNEPSGSVKGGEFFD